MDFLDELARLTDRFTLEYDDLEWTIRTDEGQWTDCTRSSAAQRAVNAYRALEGLPVLLST